MRILFATIAPIRHGPAGLTSDLASARYRVLIPARQLAREGHHVQVASLPKSGWPAEILAAPCDTLVVSKSFDAANEELARAMKARGVRVVVDFCDDYFADARYGAHFHALAALADGIVAGSAAMAEAVRRHTGREAVVIGDPVEGPRGAPRFAPRAPELRLAWFGHPSNLGGIVARVPELLALAARTPLRLAVVTTPLPEASGLLAQLVQDARGRLVGELVPWSLEATWKALAECDAAWIPVADAERTAVKSPNRLLEAAWAGRLAVADAMPAYRDFADLMPVGEGLEAGMLRALADPARVERDVGAMQALIERHHSAAACARAWDSAAAR